MQKMPDKSGNTVAVNGLDRRDAHNIGQYIVLCDDWSNAYQDYHDIREKTNTVEESDCIRIVGALFKYGISVDPHTAAALWEERSGEWEAGFLLLPDSDEKIAGDIFSYCEDFKGFRLDCEEE